jgi:hypothetical protein
MSHQVKTVKVTPRASQSSLAPGEVPLAQLRRELEAGLKYFWDNRPHLHHHTPGQGFLDFRALARR